LDPAIQTEIREKFEQESEIELQEFLKDEKYEDLIAALKSPDLDWKMRGPPNKRHYSALSPNDLPELLLQFLQFMQSEAIFLILSNLTGLRLHALAPRQDYEEDVPTLVGGSFDLSDGTTTVPLTITMESPRTSVDMEEVPDPEMVKRQKLEMTEQRSDAVVKKNDKEVDVACDPRCRYEVRRWRHGCYTLVHDTDFELCEYALDAMLYCAPKEWQLNYGGCTSYIAKGEDEELLTVCPTENSLALVYRDKDTLKFVKHINHRSAEKHRDAEFNDFAFIYYE
jgi:hypothetical protein